MKLSQEAAQAFVNLRGNSDFYDVLNWIQAHAEVAQQKCVTLDGLALNRAQGSAVTLQGILQAASESPETLNRFKQNQSP